MKISICIPQYNRIAFLKISLAKLATQDYDNLEICISDDASTDETEIEIKKLQRSYPFPILYNRFSTNEGYDRNLRKSMELATGDYIFILGNDDTLSDDSAISRLLNFLQTNHLPDVGFCNNTDFINTTEVSYRAKTSGIVGRGSSVALKYYSSFSFVAGLIFKRTAFNKVNTSKYDKSIYVQIYLAVRIITEGGTFFTYNEPLVYKDIRVNNEKANSYLDKLPRKKSDYKKLDAGLPSYTFVTAMAFKDAGIDYINYYYQIIKRLYCFTYPFWLFDYRNNNARVAALGLKEGLALENFRLIDNFNNWQKAKLKIYYHLFSLGGLFTPTYLFNNMRNLLYKIAK